MNSMQNMIKKKKNTHTPINYKPLPKHIIYDPTFSLSSFLILQSFILST